MKEKTKMIIFAYKVIKNSALVYSVAKTGFTTYKSVKNIQKANTVKNKILTMVQDGKSKIGVTNIATSTSSQKNGKIIKKI